jgi:geranylgeranyl diphosphate synthase type I
MVSEEEYLAMVERKTAYLFKASAETGALIGEASGAMVNLLGEYGRLAGIGFQIIDDILGLTADESKLGKPVGSDLRDGKKTMPIIHTLSKASSQEREATSEASGSESRETLNEALNLVVKLGGIAYAQAKAEAYVKEALTRLQPLPETPAKKDLQTLAAILVRREF